MAVIGSGNSHGACSLLHAAGTGYGASVSLDLPVIVKALDKPSKRQLNDPDDLLGNVVESWLSNGLALPEGMEKEDIHWAVASKIPPRRGLKSSAAISIAAVKALCEATATELSDSEIVAISSQSQINAGVSITGSIDDSWACLTKGWKLIDANAEAIDSSVVMEGPGLNSRKIANIPDNTELWIESIEGKWLNIYTIFYLNVGDKGYDNEQIEPSQLKGYVNKNFIEIKSDSIKKPGFWTYYYESGEIEREELHSVNFKKKIHYDDNGFINKIEELDGDDNDLIGWGPDMISNTFHKNGKIKCVNEGSAGTAVSYCFDENGKKLYSYDYEIGDYGFILLLSYH